jgi:hypothetical protein
VILAINTVRRRELFKKMVSVMNTSKRILPSLLVIFLVGGTNSEYCDPLCPAPCQPIVTQEDVTMAVVDWSLLWPDLPQDCIEAVTVVANGKKWLFVIIS